MHSLWKIHYKAQNIPTVRTNKKVNNIEKKKTEYQQSTVNLYNVLNSNSTHLSSN